jgi:mannose-6-phosphate isomerase-like protein (cupin superfamily)
MKEIKKSILGDFIVIFISNCRNNDVFEEYQFKLARKPVRAGEKNMRQGLIIDGSKLKSFTTKDKSEIKEFARSKNMSLAEAVIKAGQKTEYHFHKTSEEICYILEGEGLMEIEGEKEEISKDQVIVIPPGNKLRISSIGNNPLRFLCLCSPPYSDEDTVLVENKGGSNEKSLRTG